ncbi:hypothetical protein CHUAL_002604 [Chamberlinius hualienensis]
MNQMKTEKSDYLELVLHLELFVFCGGWKDLKIIIYYRLDISINHYNVFNFLEILYRKQMLNFWLPSGKHFKGCFIDVEKMSVMATAVKRSSSLRYFSNADGKLLGVNVTLPVTASNRHSVSLPVALDSASVKKVNAEDINEILKKRIAFTSGSNCRNGCLIITFPRWDEKESFTFDEVITTLNYLASIQRYDNGQRSAFVMLIDVQSGSLVKLKMILRAIQHSLGKQVHSVIIIKPDGVSEKDVTTADIKREKSYMDFQLYFVSRHKLGKYIDRDQLTYDLGGTLHYSHSHWLKLRKHIEAFSKDALNAIRHLESVCLRMLSFSYVPHQNDPETVLLQYTKLYDTSVDMPNRVLQHGLELIDILETDHDSGFKRALDNRQNGDLYCAKMETIRLMEEIKKKHFKFNHLWLKVKEKLVERTEIQHLESLINRVVNWILDSGEKLLASQISIGQNYLEAEKLRITHEQIELRCMESYGAYAESRHYADKLIKEQHPAAEYVSSRRDFLDNVCRNFAYRIERRRNLLITSVRFHRIVEEIFQKLQYLTFEFDSEIVAEDLQDIDVHIFKVDQSLKDLVNLRELVVKDGEHLCEIMIDAPTRNIAGLPSSIESIHVKSLISKLEIEFKRCDELADLRLLRLKQINHLTTCERDAQQAIIWILELCSVLVNSHNEVGCSLEEVYAFLDEHRKFEETAKGTYEYGRELLQTALSVRRICKYQQEPNTEISQRLFHAWKTFLIGSAERATRLKVCITFYRNSNEIQARVVQLIYQVSNDLHRLPITKQPFVYVKFKNLQSRLIGQWKETCHVGQMLIKRLPIAVIPEFKSDKNVSDKAAAQQIKESIRLVEDKLAELQLLMSKSLQAERLPVETATPISTNLPMSENDNLVSSSSPERVESSMASSQSDWHTCPTSQNTKDGSKSTEEYFSAVDDQSIGDSRLVFNPSTSNDSATETRLLSLINSTLGISDLSGMKKEKVKEMSSSTKLTETKITKTLSTGETLQSVSQVRTLEEWEKTPTSSSHTKEISSSSSKFDEQLELLKRNKLDEITDQFDRGVDASVKYALDSNLLNISPVESGATAISPEDTVKTDQLLQYITEVLVCKQHKFLFPALLTPSSVGVEEGVRQNTRRCLCFKFLSAFTAKIFAIRPTQSIALNSLTENIIL